MDNLQGGPNLDDDDAVTTSDGLQQHGSAGDGVTDYERERRENIARNQAAMREFGLGAAAASLSKSLPKNKPAPVPKMPAKKMPVKHTAKKRRTSDDDEDGSGSSSEEEEDDDDDDDFGNDGGGRGYYSGSEQDIQEDDSEDYDEDEEDDEEDDDDDGDFAGGGSARMKGTPTERKGGSSAGSKRASSEKKKRSSGGGQHKPKQRSLFLPDPDLRDRMFEMLDTEDRGYFTKEDLVRVSKSLHQFMGDIDKKPLPLDDMFSFATDNNEEEDCVLTKDAFFEFIDNKLSK